MRNVKEAMRKVDSFGKIKFDRGTVFWGLWKPNLGPRTEKQTVRACDCLIANTPALSPRKCNSLEITYLMLIGDIFVPFASTLNLRLLMFAGLEPLSTTVASRFVGKDLPPARIHQFVMTG
jgi:hypothetical protein